MIALHALLTGLLLFCFESGASPLCASSPGASELTLAGPAPWIKEGSEPVHPAETSAAALVLRPARSRDSERDHRLTALLAMAQQRPDPATTLQTRAHLVAALSLPGTLLALWNIPEFHHPAHPDNS